MIFLAKSNPPETIQEHTDNLIEQLNSLKALYNEKIPVNWDLLKYACVYHDLGKINPDFQEKLKKGKRNDNEIPHSLLSLLFLNPRELKKKFTEDEIKLLYQIIAYHHERDYSNYDLNMINNKIAEINSLVKFFDYSKISKEIKLNKISARYFVLRKRIYKENKHFKDYVLLKGLLNKIDYAASAHIPVEISNNFLLSNMEKLGYQWNDLQKYMIENRDNNVIAIAQTGMGKTEAGLLWIGNNKGFYTLPLKVAINAIYDRITKKILKDKNTENVGILHSDTYSEYLKREESIEEVDYYFTKTKQLSLPLTITTLDQLFNIVYGYKGFELKVATMSYSKIILDEIQMYSPDLLAYLILGLKIITKFGGKFSILTATFPKFLLKEFKDVGINNFIISEKPFINNDIRHSLKVIDDNIEAKYIIEKYNKNRILVICNTINQAQRIYNDLIDLGVNFDEVNLLHSKFIKKDRSNKEKEIFNLGNNYNKKGIWISTQIVEASLDIDFDILFTELSDINGLFQRMGRVYRRRIWDKDGYNVYVFTDNCSGVGKVIYKDIFELSKKSLLNINGPLSEEKKLGIIDEVYDYENIKNTVYYNKLKDNMEFVKTYNPYELEKNEVSKIFRDIDSVLVIPKDVYNENEEYINELLKKYNEKNISRKEKYKIKDEILNYTASIRCNELNNIKEIKINKYEKLVIHNCEYSKELGITYSKEENKEFNNFF
ncbi:CRISPR-associated helicase Cas3' [Marinitoga aeolica]|uniref:CRISPR-associated helicase Cas3 n=1 Tax=Marinitoga aeolica TaxID=2809031 RepID=A0ABY8PRP6_9BACT|nr:CRISPR-associated helicase Cas3' [Marinitoga aeolica]WGS65317.1 CRISPR-associated helicase Cas3' [Marinitoga aeolica]